MQAVQLRCSCTAPWLRALSLTGGAAAGMVAAMSLPCVGVCMLGCVRAMPFPLPSAGVHMRACVCAGISFRTYRPKTANHVFRRWCLFANLRGRRRWSLNLPRNAGSCSYSCSFGTRCVRHPETEEGPKQSSVVKKPAVFQSRAPEPTLTRAHRSRKPGVFAARRDRWLGATALG